MGDSYSQKVLCVIISASADLTDRYCDFNKPLTIDKEVYSVLGTLATSKIESSADMENRDVKISGLQIATQLTIGLASHIPYSSVRVEVFCVDINNVTFVTSNRQLLFKGLVYKAFPVAVSNQLSLECRPYKYYADVIAGMPAIEQCHAPYFGDPKICKKYVTSKTFVIESISDNILTVASAVTDLDKSFNKGYVEFGGVQLKIRYWVNGRSFQLSQRPPQSWLGKAVLFHYGCDKSQHTCQFTHNNISRFMGVGIGMMSYDPLYSTS